MVLESRLEFPGHDYSITRTKNLSIFLSKSSQNDQNPIKNFGLFFVYVNDDKRFKISTEFCIVWSESKCNFSFSIWLSWVTLKSNRCIYYKKLVHHILLLYPNNLVMNPILSKRRSDYNIFYGFGMIHKKSLTLFYNNFLLVSLSQFDTGHELCIYILRYWFICS